VQPADGRRIDVFDPGPPIGEPLAPGTPAKLALVRAVPTGVRIDAAGKPDQFGISVVTQETANVVQGQGLDHVNLLQAAEFAAAATLIPGVAGKVTIGGKQVLQGASGAFVSGALTDTAIQGMEGVTDGKPFSPGQVVAQSADTAIEKVDISVIRVGGAFDKGAWIPLR
jgi:hypothetical protein